jgi:hypothetical protein
VIEKKDVAVTAEIIKPSEFDPEELIKQIKQIHE